MGEYFVPFPLLSCLWLCYCDADSRGGQGLLRAAGVGGGVAAAGVVETSDLLDLWKRVAVHMGLG